VIVPAEKFPLASRATMALVVLALVAVVAEFETFPAVEIVASLVSAIPLASLALVTAESKIFAVVTSLSATTTIGVAAVLSLVGVTVSPDVHTYPAVTFAIDCSPYV
jgi:hypothetical protein